MTDALTILTAPDIRVAAPGSGGSPLAGVHARLTRDLVAFNLIAHPEWATDDLRNALRTARVADGLDGVALLVHDEENQFGGAAASPELTALRTAVLDQEEAAGIVMPTALVATTSSGGG